MRDVVARIEPGGNQRANAVGVVHGNAGRPVRWDQATKDEGEVRNGEPGFRVSHRGADQNLQIKSGRRGRGHDSQANVINRTLLPHGLPRTRREQRNCDGQAEEDLCKRRRERWKSAPAEKRAR